MALHIVACVLKQHETLGILAGSQGDSPASATQQDMLDKAERELQLQQSAFAAKLLQDDTVRQVSLS